MEKYECYWIETVHIQTYLRLMDWLVINNIDSGRYGDHAFPGVLWANLTQNEVDLLLFTALAVNIYDSKGNQLN